MLSHGRMDRQTDRQTDGQTDMTKLIIAFRNFGGAPKTKKKNNKPINNTETDVEEQEHIWVIVAFLGPGVRRF